MKSLPEDEGFNTLGKRLRNYSEMPDDEVWDKITGAMPPQDPKWIAWTINAATVISAVAFLFLMYGNYFAQESANEKALTQKSKALRIEQEEVNGVKNLTLDIASQSNASSANETPKNQEEISKLNGNSSSNISASMEPSTGVLKSDSKNSTSINHDSPNESAVELNELSGSNQNLQKNQENRNATGIVSENADTIKATKVSQDSIKISEKKILPGKKKKAKSGMTLYTMINPSLSYQKVIPTANDNITVTEFAPTPVLSSQRFGISFEAGVQGRIMNRLEYYGGLSYYQQNQTLSYQYQSGDGTSIESSGDLMSFTVTPGEHQRDVFYDMRNIGLQAGLLYYLKGDRLAHKVGAGLSFQKGFKKADTGETYDNSQSTYLFYQLLYRMEYKINEKMAVFFQPSFGHAFYSNEKLNEPFKLKPYRAAFGFGLLYQF